jgi:hypothetical protein
VLDDGRAHRAQEQAGQRAAAAAADHDGVGLGGRVDQGMPRIRRPVDGRDVEERMPGSHGGCRAVEEQAARLLDLPLQRDGVDAR